MGKVFPQFLSGPGGNPANRKHIKLLVSVNASVDDLSKLTSDETWWYIKSKTKNRHQVVFTCGSYYLFHRLSEHKIFFFFIACVHTQLSQLYFDFKT